MGSVREKLTQCLSRRQRKILSLLRATPLCSSVELALLVGESQRNVHQSLLSLGRRGLVRASGTKRAQAIGRYPHCWQLKEEPSARPTEEQEVGTLLPGDSGGQDPT